jgi:transcriptional regulator with XRE-family HTH domain
MRAVKHPDLKSRRLALGLSQPELAEALGVHPMTLSKWEREVLSVPVYIDLAVEALENRRRLATKTKKK